MFGAIYLQTVLIVSLAKSIKIIEKSWDFRVVTMVEKIPYCIDNKILEISQMKWSQS